MTRFFLLVLAAVLFAPVRPLGAGEGGGRASTPVKSARGSLFDPGKFTSLGVLRVGAGQTVTFATGGKDTLPTVSGAVTGAGGLGHSQSGQVEVAVFAFDSIELAKDATVQVTGDRGLVLVASGAILVDGILDVSGEDGKKWSKGGLSGEELAQQAGVPIPAEGSEEAKAFDRLWRQKALWQHAAKGGPGGEGGEEGKTFVSNPPSMDGGDSSPAAKDCGFSARGHGAGFNRRVKGGAAGGGGGYGGGGGASSIASSGGANGKERKPMSGGVAYGDESLKDLFGGSGGAGGSNDRRFDSASGGGGGGALSLVSKTSITLGATCRLLATGGNGGVFEVCGGGGSGGALLLAAPKISITAGAVIDASGGNGGSNGGAKTEIDTGNGRLNKGSGGGGGGGRIAFFCGETFKTAPKGITVTGGMGGAEAANGADGTFHSGRF